ncbi:hypothetical protein HRG_012852 [Hirsutella rhossiliensis]
MKPYTDPRFSAFQAPGPDDGMKINDLILACFQGFGLSPETNDVQRQPWNIEHDCSFSRVDWAEGDINTIDLETWNVALEELEKCDVIDAARIKAERARNPNTLYNDKAAAHGAAEVGMILSVLSPTGETNLSFIRSIIEEQRIPTHLGYMPRESAYSNYSCAWLRPPVL